MKLHPKVLKKNGRSEFVVLPYDEFQALRERLADREDLIELRKAVRADDAKAPGLTLDQLKSHLGLGRRTRRGRRSRASAR